MPLVASLLAQQLLPAIQGVVSFEEAASGWTDPYVVYGQLATAAGAVPVFTGLERLMLLEALQAAFEAGVTEPASTPYLVEAAFQVYWAAPPVVFGVGAVSLAPPGLAALLLAIPPVETAVEAAQNLADALDSWTKLVTVTFPNGTTATLL